MKKLTAIGLTITAFWVVLVLSIVYFNRTEAAGLQLNAWGDFLGGLTAPLALLWIVIGYFQQGGELRLNTAALKTQQEELRRQVEETAILAANSERQAIASEQMAMAAKDEGQREALRANAALQPLFRSDGGDIGASIVLTRFTNVGASVTNLTAKAEDPVHIEISPTELIETGRSGKLRMSNVSRYPYWFEVSYDDTTGTSHTKKYEMLSAYRFKEM